MIRRSSNLAYIVGFAIGDGNLSNPNGRAVRLRVSCDLKYPNLIENFKKAIALSFPNNKVSIVRTPRNALDISCYSNHWETVLGWKANKGSKFAQNVDIPKWVFEKKKYVINCLRGLIETDGSIYHDRGYKMVMFTSIIPCLAESVYTAINLLGFEPRMYKLEKQTSKYGLKKNVLYHVRISKDTEKFLKLIKPNKS